MSVTISKEKWSERPAKEALNPLSAFNPPILAKKFSIKDNQNFGVFFVSSSLASWGKVTKSNTFSKAALYCFSRVRFLLIKLTIISKIIKKPTPMPTTGNKF
ncbi:MAG: hypothetical protein BWY03_00385 [Parcubacteria group bacterium ADurb.Bin159]|nr:MAG: hypothetical protein BWY03_00385 [Parcubacteria group bacterium ADurb.Bin159]